MHAQIDAGSDPERVELRAHCLRREVGGEALTHSPGFTLTISRNETVFLVGPSGCGKTSILRCLSLLDAVESGSLELNGLPARDWSVPRWRSLVRYVHQQRIAFEGTPRKLFQAWASLSSQRRRPHRPLEPLIVALGLEPAIIDQGFATLSVRKPSGKGRSRWCTRAGRRRPEGTACIGVATGLTLVAFGRAFPPFCCRRAVSTSACRLPSRWP